MIGWDMEVLMRLVQHTWQWLSTRLPAKAIWREEHSAPAQSALPAAELLGDRIMMDGTVALVEGQQIKGESDTQILIGLLKGELEFSKLQLNTLAMAWKISLDEELVQKLANEWLDVNDVLSKFGEALIKGELSEHKFDKFVNKINAELADVSAVASKIEGQNKLGRRCRTSRARSWTTSRSWAISSWVKT
jgi:hypothetical protein